ncbi:hypothetical protein CUMW_172340 [Citrus unshiu]|uniref:Uncharacterized protein n=1 Tax=Citrus unshiu TaxID=55188 RepID=A0A2H5PWQ5_CITUN|nr:hypothetical protein CUMW_172340 [Citrus unshiu]
MQQFIKFCFPHFFCQFICPLFQ